ncbi:pantothenate transporter liz1 [Plectosphaerella plurivora]|uniref:Pantothenate transporter liz1 n=1 Tax=Plectosphaerella plurivora TaxID=936078 RepID=A0A9P8V244_9PEZI|nr:pantothenate transporter liz1 [Plectosphaerella plurivora]
MADVAEVDLDDKETEKRVVGKQDLHLLPWMCIAYLLNYLNRVNLGNARTLNDDIPADNILQRLNLSGTRYNVAIAVFFIPYVIMEFPGNMLMQYFSPSKWISRIVISVGIVTMCTAAATTYERLLAARFFLGMAEAGFSSGVMMHLCFWYKPEERATRMAIFASSVALACAFGGLLASGISFLTGFGGLAGWQWLFILEGLPAILIGILVWFFLPDYPQTATWLTPHERTFAVKRLGPYAPSMQSGAWEWKVVKDTIVDPIFWLFAVQYSLMTHALIAYGYFAPTIVSSLGFTGHRGQLLTVPPNIFALIVVVGACLHSDKTRERSRHIVAALTFVATGYLVLATVENWGLRYAAVCVIACTNAAVLPFIAHRTATVKGSTATAVATGGMVAISNSAGISAPFLFPPSTAPMFSMGNWTIFAFLVASIGTSLYAWYVFGSHSGYRGDLEVLEKTNQSSDFTDVESASPASASTLTLEVDVAGQVDEKEVVVEVRSAAP